MTTDDAATGQVRASAAEIYDRFFVPALFAQWTEPMLDLARVEPGDAVLDVGCGTGVLTRAAARRVGAAGSSTGLDRNPGMLAVARRAPEPIDWHQGLAEALPFEDHRFDRVVCQFALMFFEDRAAALAEMARVVRPGGRVAVATWARVEQSPGYEAMIALVERVIGRHAADALVAPFGIGRAPQLAGLLGAAFDDVVISTVDGFACFPSIEAWVHTDVRGWTLADAIDDRQEAELLGAARRELARFVAADGRVEFPAPALIGRGSTAAS